ncbi:MAG: RhuM family protein [Tepidanaerobacteraceae bacterium]|nr:RhuM family protein [Tepidanaerobacteraceae bacterium]
MSDDLTPKKDQILLYTTEDGDIKIDVFFQDETVWLTQKMMAELFDVGVNTINYHLKEVFNSGELNEEAVIRKYRITASDGKRYNTNFYNLDAIISVGYRVNSVRATQFRIWATKTLREYIIKGFVLDDERLKNGRHFGKDYFDELLERIYVFRLCRTSSGKTSLDDNGRLGKKVRCISEIS